MLKYIAKDLERIDKCELETQFSETTVNNDFLIVKLKLIIHFFGIIMPYVKWWLMERSYSMLDGSLLWFTFSAVILTINFTVLPFFIPSFLLSCL